MLVWQCPTCQINCLTATRGVMAFKEMCYFLAKTGERNKTTCSSTLYKHCLTVLKPGLNFVGDGFDEFDVVLRVVFLVSEQFICHLLKHGFHGCVTESVGNATHHTLSEFPRRSWTGHTKLCNSVFITGKHNDTMTRLWHELVRESHSHYYSFIVHLWPHVPIFNPQKIIFMSTVIAKGWPLKHFEVLQSAYFDYLNSKYTFCDHMFVMFRTFL